MANNALWLTMGPRVRGARPWSCCVLWFRRAALVADARTLSPAFPECGQVDCWRVFLRWQFPVSFVVYPAFLMFESKL